MKTVRGVAFYNTAMIIGKGVCIIIIILLYVLYIMHARMRNIIIGVATGQAGQ